MGSALPQIIAASLLLRGKYSSPASLAYHLGVSRARVTPIMNLLKLCPEVIEIVSDLGNKKES
jgi:biotin operon repressor